MILVIQPYIKQFQVVKWRNETLVTSSMEGVSQIENHHEETLFVGSMDQCKVFASELIKEHNDNLKKNLQTAFAATEAVRTAFKMFGA